MYMSEHAIHFWRSGSRSKELIQSVNYKKFPSFSGDYSPDINIESRVHRLKLNKTVSKPDKQIGTSGRHPLLRLGQKAVSVTRHVIRKYSDPGLDVIDPCFRTGATANECLLETKHRKFHGWEADRHCVDMMMASLVKVFESQVLKKELDINKELTVKSGVGTFLNDQNTRTTERWKQVWPHSRGFPPVQTCPAHIVQVLSQYQMDMTLYNNAS